MPTEKNPVVGFYNIILSAVSVDYSINHGSVVDMAGLCLNRSPFCEEVVSCRGDHVRLAVRVRVFPYLESACAVWIMFACKYRSVL